MSTATCICPRCCQGEVLLQRIRATGELLQVGEECEAAWLAGEAVLLPTFQQLSGLMDERGFSDLWVRELEEPGEG